MEEMEDNIYVNKLNVWKKLEEGWEEFDKENKFGCIAYTCAKIPSHNDNTKTTERDNQERCLPANRFSLDGEEHFESDKPWKKKRSLFGGSEDGSEDEASKDSRTCKKSKRSRKMPRLSRDSTASLSQGISSGDNSSGEDKEDNIREHSQNNYEGDSLVGE